ncbi:hypothetical protein B0J13DRAFT_250206 [Dactylonectria estremocensis]|uniref:Uncharacterized protein n=1 Tax=Dactylonectria estremocensis TaxID=1079267 RepID=A0A9P9F3Y6_9HYPO|nr:hypothetical protein B0J13DRAFT_250206 [Dactylonectria estremocensis]
MQRLNFEKGRERSAEREKQICRRSGSATRGWHLKTKANRVRTSMTGSCVVRLRCAFCVLPFASLSLKVRRLRGRGKVLKVEGGREGEGEREKGRGKRNGCVMSASECVLCKGKERKGRRAKDENELLGPRAILSLARPTSPSGPKSKAKKHKTSKDGSARARRDAGRRQRREGRFSSQWSSGHAGRRSVHFTSSSSRADSRYSRKESEVS